MGESSESGEGEDSETQSDGADAARGSERVCVCVRERESAKQTEASTYGQAEGKGLTEREARRCDRTALNPGLIKDHKHSEWISTLGERKRP